MSHFVRFVLPVLVFKICLIFANFYNVFAELEICDLRKRFLAIFCSRYIYYQLCVTLEAHIRFKIHPYICQSVHTLAVAKPLRRSRLDAPSPTRVYVHTKAVAVAAEGRPLLLIGAVAR